MNKQSATRKVVKKKSELKNYASTFIVVMLLFAFAVSFRSSLIEERSVEIQSERNRIEQIKNENAELNLGLQKSLSLTNIEKQAKNKLGMQKLDNSQIRYVKLDKQDYVEPVSATRIEETKASFFEKVLSFFGF